MRLPKLKAHRSDDLEVSVRIQKCRDLWLSQRESLELPLGILEHVPAIRLRNEALRLPAIRDPVEGIAFLLDELG